LRFKSLTPAAAVTPSLSGSSLFTSADIAGIDCFVAGSGKWLIRTCPVHNERHGPDLIIEQDQYLIVTDALSLRMTTGLKAGSFCAMNK
jgi:hypothetical protein